MNMFRKAQQTYAMSPPPPPRRFESPVADLSLRYHCDLSCKWVTKKPSCNREADSLLAYFKKHGKFHIVEREYADDYPRCPLYESK